MASLFAIKGIRTVIAGRDEKRGRSAAVKVSALGTRSSFAIADVADPHSVQTMMATALQELRHIDYTCQCAGFEGALGSIIDRDLHEFDRTMEINARGTWLCLAEELAHMSSRKSGAIVNISSIRAGRPVRNAAAYAASKAAIESLTRTASIEAAPLGVRVNAVTPGAVDTPMRTRLNDAAGTSGIVPVARPRWPDGNG